MNNKLLYNIFDSKLLDACPDEWGIVINCLNPNAIGYATTLTPEVIRQAITKNINLLVTHHDVWDFMLDERGISLDLLSQAKISHVWCHAPLDTADFGPAAAMLSIIGCKVIGKIAKGGGRIGELPKPLHILEMVKLLDDQLMENPCRKYDANRPVTRIACVPGAGIMNDYVAEALRYDIDLYVTGETSLYLLEYARFHEINVLIYSHNYTEIYGIKNLAVKIADTLGIKEIMRLDEPHF